MFDFTKLRTLSIDQLRPWVIYETQQDLLTVDGRIFRAGTEFRFEFAIANVPARKAEIHGLGPEDEEVVFQSEQDAHRKWFVNSGREWRPGPKVRTGPAPKLEDPEFEEAAAILKQKSPVRQGTWSSSREEAHILLQAAKAMERGGNLEAAKMLADKSLDHYHGWMSQATSGGEGTAMSYEVRDELKEAHRILAITD